MSEESKLYFTIGLPGSGKSSQSALWKNSYAKIENGKLIPGRFCGESRVVVSGDSIRKAICGESWNSNIEGIVDSTKYIMVKALLDNGHTVLIDDTNTSINTIQKILSIDINAQPLYVKSSVEECKGRRPGFEKIIERMKQNIIDLVSCKSPYGFEIESITTKSIIDNIDYQREGLIRHRDTYTNEPINTQVSKMPTIQGATSLNNTSGRNASLNPIETFQVW